MRRIILVNVKCEERDIDVNYYVHYNSSFNSSELHNLVLTTEKSNACIINGGLVNYEPVMEKMKVYLDGRVKVESNITVMMEYL